MRIIDVDASRCRTVVEFLTALRSAIGAPQGHGWSPDAFVDSMIWGGMNSVEPPYEVHVRGSGSVPNDVRDYIELMASVIAQGRKWKLDNRGQDTEVSIRVV